MFLCLTESLLLPNFLLIVCLLLLIDQKIVTTPSEALKQVQSINLGPVERKVPLVGIYKAVAAKIFF